MDNGKIPHSFNWVLCQPRFISVAVRIEIFPVFKTFYFFIFNYALQLMRWFYFIFISFETVCCVCVCRKNDEICTCKWMRVRLILVTSTFIFLFYVCVCVLMLFRVCLRCTGRTIDGSIWVVTTLCIRLFIYQISYLFLLHCHFYYTYCKRTHILQ